MKISSLIEKLESLKAKHGDLEVGVLSDDNGSTTRIVNVLAEQSNQPETTDDDWHRDDESLGDIFIQIVS